MKLTKKTKEIIPFLIIVLIIVSLFIWLLTPADCNRYDYCEDYGFDSYRYEVGDLVDWDFYCSAKAGINTENNKLNTKKEARERFIMDSQYKEWKEICIE